MAITKISLNGTEYSIGISDASNCIFVATATDNLPDGVDTSSLVEGATWLIEDTNGEINQIGIYSDGVFTINDIKNTERVSTYEGTEIDYTWAELKTKCTNNDFDDLKIGDYKTIELTNGETVKCQIAGIDTYYNTYNQTVHHIDFISKDCLYDYVQWNTSNTNQGDSTNSCPYMVSNVYDYLTNTIYATLPSDLQAVIGNKYFYLETRYSSSSDTLTDSTSYSAVNLGKVWLPSEYEVFGSIVRGTKPYSGVNAVQYPIFANSWNHRIKGRGNGGGRCTWWLSTVTSGNSTSCVNVNPYGHVLSNSASNNFYVPLCFRVSA